MNDQPRKSVETPRAWLRYAISELGVAARELESETPAYPTICFLCQSAAEKFLKGYLIAQGWSLEKTHDLVKLLALCADYDAELGAMVVEGAVLNEYIVGGRYPGDIAFEDIGPAQAKEAPAAAQRIGDRVTALIGTE